MLSDDEFEQIIKNAVAENRAALERLADTSTPSDEDMDFELGAACDLGDTDCESCQ